MMREKQLAARKQLKGDRAKAPASTSAGSETKLTLDKSLSPKHAAQAFLDDNSADTEENQDAVNAWIENTKNAGPFPFSPFGRADFLLLMMICLGFYFVVLYRHDIDLWPHIWWHIMPHYDHHDDNPADHPDLPDLSPLLGDL